MVKSGSTYIYVYFTALIYRVYESISACLRCTECHICPHPSCMVDPNLLLEWVAPRGPPALELSMVHASCSTALLGHSSPSRHVPSRTIIGLLQACLLVNVALAASGQRAMIAQNFGESQAFPNGQIACLLSLLFLCVRSGGATGKSARDSGKDTTSKSYTSTTPHKPVPGTSTYRSVL